MKLTITPEGRTLTLERKDCYCGDGRQLAPLPCPTCSGTGKGKRGGARGCKGPCHGSGRTYSSEVTKACSRCGGNPVGFTAEGRCDDAPEDTLADVDLQILYVDRAGTWNEAYLGLGSLVSVTDYGRSFDARDPEALAAEVRERHLGRTQAIKIARFDREATEGDTARVADTVAVIVHRNGYVLVAVLDGEPIR